MIYFQHLSLTSHFIFYYRSIYNLLLKFISIIIFPGILLLTQPNCGNSMIILWDENNPSSWNPSMNLRFSALSAGGLHNCAIRSDTSEVVCWGRDNSGQVSKTPSGGAFKEISAGRNHTCAIRSSDNTTTCWGALEWNPR